MLRRIIVVGMPRKYISYNSAKAHYLLSFAIFCYLLYYYILSSIVVYYLVLFLTISSPTISSSITSALAAYFTYLLTLALATPFPSP